MTVLLTRVGMKIKTICLSKMREFLNKTTVNV